MPDPLGVDPRVSVAALGVSSVSADQMALRSMFEGLQWQWDIVPSLEKARQRMHHGATPGVVVCQHLLPDGDWKLLFQEVLALPRPPRFVVLSRLADEDLWMDVLNCGGYDLLSIPFYLPEVSRVLQSAARSWHVPGVARRTRHAGGGAS